MSKILTSSKKRSAFFASLVVKMCAIAGIAAMAVSAQTDLARGKTATASSTEGSYIASNAVDGNSGTRWASLFSDPQWIQVDLAASYEITRVILTWEFASARDYTIEVSSNVNGPWTNFATRTNMGSGERIDNCYFYREAPIGRYIRMHGTARTTQWGYSLFSFEVYGVGQTNNTLSTSVNPAGTGTISLSPSGGSYAAGTVVTVSATAASGYQFSSWSGALSGTANSATITMNGNYSIVANFTPVSGGYQAGDMSYYNGSIWTRVPRGQVNQVLSVSSGLIPQWKDMPRTYNVGDFVQGGIVFWVDVSRQHGLVVAKTDQSTGIRWHAGSQGYTRASGVYGPYVGRTNTSIIIAAHIALGDDGQPYAASICNELLVIEGEQYYGDWYLPSVGDLTTISANFNTINAAIVANGGSAIANARYWSSTDAASTIATFYGFGNGNSMGGDYKTSTNRVRAVRAF